MEEMTQVPGFLPKVDRARSSGGGRERAEPGSKEPEAVKHPGGDPCRGSAGPCFRSRSGWAERAGGPGAPREGWASTHRPTQASLPRGLFGEDCVGEWPMREKRWKQECVCPRDFAVMRFISSHGTAPSL